MRTRWILHNAIKSTDHHFICFERGLTLVEKGWSEMEKNQQSLIKLHKNFFEQ